MIGKILFMILFIGSFLYCALSPLPEERDLPKEKRTPNIAKCYWETLKK